MHFGTFAALAAPHLKSWLRTWLHIVSFFQMVFTRSPLIHNLCIDFIFIRSNVHLKGQSVDYRYTRIHKNAIYIYIFNKNNKKAKRNSGSMHSGNIRTRFYPVHILIKFWQTPWLQYHGIFLVCLFLLRASNYHIRWQLQHLISRRADQSSCGTLCQHCKMRTRWDILKIVTIAQLFTFKWHFSCCCRRRW